jgi:hypothetical protein
MTDTPQMSGLDLARQALKAYKATASTAPTQPAGRAKKKRTVRTGSARDPISLASAITGLGADIPLDAGIAGGNVIAQWATLCPQYVGLVQPISYDEHTGRLDLRPSSHSYAAQLRLLGGQLARQINDKLGRPVVHTIRVLPVGNVDTVTVEREPAPKQTTPEPSARARDSRYQDALSVVLEHKPERPPVNPYVEDAMRRQEASLRANREPETAFTDAVAEQERLAGPSMSSSERSRRAALAYKRNSGREPRQVFGTI